jgi:hypothetical protein
MPRSAIFWLNAQKRGLKWGNYCMITMVYIDKNSEG